MKQENNKALISESPSAGGGSPLRSKRLCHLCAAKEAPSGELKLLAINKRSQADRVLVFKGSGPEALMLSEGVIDCLKNFWCLKVLSTSKLT